MYPRALNYHTGDLYEYKNCLLLYPHAYCSHWSYTEDTGVYIT